MGQPLTLTHLLASGDEECCELQDLLAGHLAVVPDVILAVADVQRSSVGVQVEGVNLLEPDAHAQQVLAEPDLECLIHGDASPYRDALRA